VLQHLVQLIRLPEWQCLLLKWAAKCHLKCLQNQKQPQAALDWAEHVDNAIP
jgi:hypothetical protein